MEVPRIFILRKGIKNWEKKCIKINTNKLVEDGKYGYEKVSK